MENELTIIFCSQKEASDNESFIRHLRETCGCNSSILSLYNPSGVSLSKVYADVMPLIKTENAVFIHDDIEFLKRDWGVEILRLFNNNKDYGIIGVAGSAEFDTNGAWWRYKKIFGQVLHRNEGKSWLTAFSPLLEKDLQEVVVIDGLFMAVNTKRIAFNFSKDINGFDFYDIDFCLNNFLSNKCKIGVTTNIRIAHNSIGKLKPSWYKNREIINNKYGNHFPLEIKI